MPDVKNLTAKQAREKLGVVQEKLGKVFTEALVSGDSGEKQYDFNKVTCLGADVKGSIAVAEKVHDEPEANELAEHAETLELAERAAKEHGDREKAGKRPTFPTGDGRDFSRQIAQLKSLGELIVEEKSFKEWNAKGSGGGITLKFEDLSLSDILAKAAAFDTIGTKTLMTTAAGFAPQSIRLPGFVEAATRPIQLLDIIPLAQTGTSRWSIWKRPRAFTPRPRRPRAATMPKASSRSPSGPARCARSRTACRSPTSSSTMSRLSRATSTAG
jgi:hypothetical protein